MAHRKITILDLHSRKQRREQIPMLTCYDCPTARLMVEGGIDVLLVGDTYAEVVLGHPSTLPATLDLMVNTAQAVRRGAPKAFIIGDMPYLTYQASPVEAIHNAGRLMAEGGCDAVKVEVDSRLRHIVAAMADATLPVVAHLGLKPQSIHRIGGYRGQGKTADAALQVIEDARIMEDAGACMLLLEAVPSEVAAIVTERSDVPVIGCACGPGCDGTVVVMHDMLGYQSGHPPRSVKAYADLHGTLVSAFAAFGGDIRSGAFPGVEHGMQMDPEELAGLRRRLAAGPPTE